MTETNEVYTVTPPDLRLSTFGPTAVILGADMEVGSKFINLYDKLFPEVEITVYVAEDGYTSENAAWYRATCGMASSIFVNINGLTQEELFLAMQAEADNKAMVFWIAETSCDLAKLLGSYQYQIFTSIDAVEQFLVDHYSKP